MENCSQQMAEIYKTSSIQKYIAATKRFGIINQVLWNSSKYNVNLVQISRGKILPTVFLVRFLMHFDFLYLNTLLREKNWTKITRKIKNTVNCKSIWMHGLTVYCKSHQQKLMGQWPAHVPYMRISTLSLNA